jgi:hypothetical protein
MDEKNNKREKFIGEEKKGFEFKLVYVIGLLIVAAAVLFIITSGGSGPEKAENLGGVSGTPQGNAGSGNVSGSTNTGTDNSLYIPVSKVNDGIAHFYTYESSTSKTIRFFVLKSSDGVIRAAFDACDVCYEAKKGYHQEGDFMVCNNCGMKFPSAKINEESGGCNPSPLKREIEGDSIVILKEEIEKGARFF